METSFGNMAGNFDELDVSCPRCNSKKVVVCADEHGYFGVLECSNCGFKNYSKCP